MRKQTKNGTKITAGATGANHSEERGSSVRRSSASRSERAGPRVSRLLTTALGLALAVSLGPLAGQAFAIDDDPQYPDEPTPTTPKETPRHKAVVSGSLEMRDDEGLISTTGISEWMVWNFDTTTSFGTSTRPAETRTVKSACNGGEMYGTTWMKFVDTGPTTADVWFQYRLFEGTSCSTTDLDGHKTVGPIKLTAGESRTYKVLVYNTDEHGWDYGCEYNNFCDTDFIRFNINLKLTY